MNTRMLLAAFACAALSSLVGCATAAPPPKAPAPADEDEIVLGGYLPSMESPSDFVEVDWQPAERPEPKPRKEIGTTRAVKRQMNVRSFKGQLFTNDVPGTGAFTPSDAAK